MSRPISVPQPPWTGDQLADAIKECSNWRSATLLLAFGERSKSAGAIRLVRRRATELNIGHARGLAEIAEDTGGGEGRTSA